MKGAIILTIDKECKLEFEEWKEANKLVAESYLFCIRSQQKKIRTEQKHLKRLENLYYQAIICDKPGDVR